jgi:hypothetical protein
MRNVNRKSSAALSLLTLSAVASAAACAGDTVYLPADGDIRAQAQGIDNADGAASDAGTDTLGNAESEATLGDASAPRTYCHVVDRGSNTTPLRFACDLTAPFATLDIPACPCTYPYCRDGSGETDAGVGDGGGFAFPAVVLSQTCELVAKDSMGLTLRCAAHVLAAYPCDGVETKCDNVPQTAHEALAAGTVPDGICSVQQDTFFRNIDLDGYWQI